MPSLSSIFLTTALAALTAAAPAASLEPRAECKDIYQPDVYTVFPDAPDHAYGSNHNRTFYMTQEESGKDARLAVLVWKDLPKTDNCNSSIGWTQPLEGTNFGYFGLASFRYYQLDLNGKSFQDTVGDDVTWGKIAEIAGASSHVAEPTKAKHVGGSAHEFWPQDNDASSHGVGTATACGGDLAVYVRFLLPDEGMLVMTQSEELKAGHYLSVC